MPTAEHAPTTSGEDLIARLRTHQVTTIAELHAINGEPQQRFLEKHTSYLTPLLERFITAAPFFLIATADADGNCDVRPKGDPPAASASSTAGPSPSPIALETGAPTGTGTSLPIPTSVSSSSFRRWTRRSASTVAPSSPPIPTSSKHEGAGPGLRNWPPSSRSTRSTCTARGRSSAPFSGNRKNGPIRTPSPPWGAISCEQKDLQPPDESQGKRQEEYRSTLY